MAKAKRFVPPQQGGHLIFYIPVPKTWKKYKQREMHNQLHTSTPDWDNLAKAFFDGLMADDKGIADVRVTKIWVNEPKGRIEFITDIPTIRSQDTLI